MIKGKRLVNSKKQTIDGIKFASRLEAYMYTLLKSEGLTFEYEGKSFVLLDSFKFKNSLYARQSNGKGEFKDRGNSKIRGMKYTPDFIVEEQDYYAIIETKGVVTPEFAQRFKLFINKLYKENIKVDLFMPRNQNECQKTLNIILDEIKRTPKKTSK